jgi:hypothetical protein
MHQAPQQSRPAQSGLAAASIRVQQGLRSMRARLGQARLDEQLAAGMRPDSDPLLRERARYLLSRDSRLKMALGLGRALHKGGRPALHSAQVPVRSQAIRDAAPTLEMLARRLRGSLPIGPQGAAKTKILLTDGSSPLYNPNSEVDLKTAARRALAALDVDSGRWRVMPHRVCNPGW